MADTVLENKQLSNSSYSHVINAPIEKIDIAAWLFKLPEAEYRRCCPPDHISCGTTSTDEGKALSINVEMIGRTLMIQHYVAEVATATLCHMVSISDAFTPNGHTRVQVIWTGLANRRLEPSRPPLGFVGWLCGELLHSCSAIVHRVQPVAETVE